MKLFFVLSMVGIFQCGGTFYINLSRLVEINPNYDAAWWKVGLAAVLGAYLSVYSWNTAKQRKGWS